MSNKIEVSRELLERLANPKDCDDGYFDDIAELRALLAAPVVDLNILDIKGLLQRVIDASVLSFEADAPEELESLEADICAAILALNSNSLREHCKQCADVVRTWPEPKRDCLGKIAPVVERHGTLPCDVRVAPATTIRKGCKVETLMQCIELRKGQPHEFTVFKSSAPPELAELQATIARLTAENERLKESHEQICANYNEVSHASEKRGNQIDELKSEIERLKAGQGEPVAYGMASELVRIKKRPSQGHMVYGSPNGAYDVALYTSQPAPVAVVVDETQAFANWMHEVIATTQHLGNEHKIQRRDHMSLTEEQAAFDAWNARACLDKVKELNK